MPAAQNHDPKPSPKAHELIKIIYVQMQIEGMNRTELARRSGVPMRTLNDWWRARHSPDLHLVEAALGVFDLKLKVSGK
jgi:transcriptional regulator with XRE-family HTH domain